MVQVPRAHDLVRLRPQRRCPPQRLVPGVRVADPAPVGLQSRDVAQTSESSRQTHGSAGQRRRRVQSRRHSASRRLGPYDEVMIEQESTTRMTMPDDEIATALQVVGMDLAQLVGPHALYPRRNPTANVGATPGALPELTVRPRVAAPIWVSFRVRLSHAQVVKSSKLSKPWYSFQTSQRPSKAPHAWSNFGSGNALILITALVLVSTRATPEKRGEYTSAQNERPSCAKARGTMAVVFETAVT